MEINEREMAVADLIMSMARRMEQEELIRDLLRRRLDEGLGRQGILGLLERFHADRLAFVNAVLRGRREAGERRAAWEAKLGEAGIRRWRRDLGKRIDAILDAHARPAWRLVRNRAMAAGALASRIGGSPLPIDNPGVQGSDRAGKAAAQAPLAPLIVLAMDDAPGVQSILGPGSYAVWSLVIQEDDEDGLPEWSFATGHPAAASPGPCGPERPAVALKLVPYQDVPHAHEAAGLPEIRALGEADPDAPVMDVVAARCARRHGDLPEKVGGYVTWDNLSPTPHGADAGCTGPYTSLIQLVGRDPGQEKMPCTLYRCDQCGSVWAEPQGT